MVGNAKDTKVDLNKLTSPRNKNRSYTLDPTMALELTKAMLGRGVDCEVAEQILIDFQKRMNSK